MVSAQSSRRCQDIYCHIIKPSRLWKNIEEENNEKHKKTKYKRKHTLYFYETNVLKLINRTKTLRFKESNRANKQIDKEICLLQAVIQEQ